MLLNYVRQNIALLNLSLGANSIVNCRYCTIKNNLVGEYKDIQNNIILYSCICVQPDFLLYKTRTRVQNWVLEILEQVGRLFVPIDSHLEFLDITLLLISEFEKS